MSNRCYLFSTNFIPGSERTVSRRAIGVSEFPYDVPLAFKLLLSGHPQTCTSLIFEETDRIALVGDYGMGISSLMQFLDRIPHPAVPRLKEEARDFLESDENKSTFFVLEPAEVFAMSGDSVVEQNQLLLAELSELEVQMEKVILEIQDRIREETNPPGFFARLFRAHTPTRESDSNDLIYRLGLGEWTNVLFWEPKLV